MRWQAERDTALDGRRACDSQEKRRRASLAAALHRVPGHERQFSPTRNSPGFQSIFQCAKVGDQRLDIRIIEFCAEPGHFAFDAFLDDFSYAGIGFPQVVEARPLIAARVIAMAMGAIVVKQAVAPLGFALHTMTRGCGNDVG